MVSEGLNGVLRAHGGVVDLLWHSSGVGAGVSGFLLSLRGGGGGRMASWWHDVTSGGVIGHWRHHDTFATIKSSFCSVSELA